MKFLVTGAAGFIGFHVVQRLCEQGHEVIGIDNLNDYYDVNLKLARLTCLEKHPLFTFIKLDLADREGIAQLFSNEKFDRVIHLAAQAGVRYSIDNPMAYADSNLVGHLTILEGCRNNNVKHLVYASSSSVYGLNSKVPFATSDTVDHPISLYAATKKSNELMSHTYSHLYNIPTTGLRFFTVYGPWGRPDMALFKFTKAIENGESIDVYNNGDMRRDFTYIDDIVEGIIRIQDIIPQKNNDWSVENNSAATSSAPYKIFNIGNGNPVKLLDFIQSLENSLGVTANKNLMPMQPGDVYHIEQVNDRIWLAGDKGFEILNHYLQSESIISSETDICFDKRKQAVLACDGTSKIMVYQAQTNTVWLGTANGLFAYNNTTKELTPYTNANQVINGTSNPEIRALTLDSHGTLWIGTPCGLYKKPIYQTTLITVDSCYAPSQKLTSTNIRALTIDSAHNLWVGTAIGVNWLNIDNEKHISTKIKPNSLSKHSLSNPVIRSLHADNQGRIWVGTNNGLSVTNTHRLQIQSFRAPADSTDFGNYIYSFINFNNAEQLYVSSDKGLSVINPTKIQEKAISIINTETIYDAVQAGDTIWAGGRDSLYQIDPITNKVIKTFNAENSPLNNRHIYKLLSKNSSQLWLGTSNGLFLYDISTDDWSYWNTHQGLVDGEIYELQWINNHLWIGTQNGISVFDLTNNAFTNYDSNNSDFSSKWVFDIEQINDSVYIASGGGVYEFTNEKFHYLPIVNGNAYSIVPLLNNRLLVTTNKGITMYDELTRIVQHLDIEDGLADNEFNYNAHYTNGNNIYLGNSTGFTIIPLSYIENTFSFVLPKKELILPSYITQARVDGKDFDMWQPSPISNNSLITTKELNVEWKYNQVVLQISNPYFATQKHKAYLKSPLMLTSNFKEYSLEKKSINLQILADGKYALMLDRDKAITLEKLPHPFLSHFAKFLYFICFLSITFVFIRFYYLKKHAIKLKNKNDLIEHQNKTINEHLKFKEHIFYQVQHSLKSPVSASRGLLYLLEQQVLKSNFDKPSLLRKTQKLHNAQTKLAELIEQILIISKPENTTPIESIQNIKDVFHSVLPIMQELANQKNIQIITEFNNLRDDARVSTIEMGLFIIYENIITNTIKYSPENTEIMIKINQSDNKLVLSVIDNGIGINEKDQLHIFEMFYRGDNSADINGSGLGLALIKKIIDDMNGTIEIRSNLNKGTVVNVYLNLLDFSNT